MTSFLSTLARPLLGSLALAGCAPLDLLDAVVATTAEERRLGVAYGPGPRQRLDLYLPAPGARPPAVVVFVHGGSWSEGRRGQYRFVGQELATRGYVAVVPDYRLHPEGRWPGFVEDVAAAVAWTVRNATDLGGDPGRIVLMGHSAGAYNAAMVATEPKWLAAHGIDRAAIAGFVGLSGPYDFLPLADPVTRRVFGHVESPEATQPVRVAAAGAPPTLLVHGGDDDTVLPRNSHRLAERMRSLGVPVTLRLHAGTGHAGTVLAFSPLSRDDPPVASELARFVADLPAAPGVQSASEGFAAR
ncbi:alpha/beta hydrolase [Stella sp.]|uniref:alpha/beta hydrolase n=1 Tax=Stella sp. TaxID=2912054 RepID=UPI0035B019CA